MKITNEFLTELLSNLELIGYSIKNIECILQEGSSLYLDNYDDIDFKIMVKHINPNADIGRQFDVKGHKVDCTYYTFKDWAKVGEYMKVIYFITESPDMICIYGSDKNFVRHNVVKNKKLALKVLDNYEKCLFDYKEGYQLHGYHQMPPKRLWNFLVFYYKLKNGRNRIYSRQLQQIKLAHDLKLSVEDCKGKFHELCEMLKGEQL